MQGNALVTGGAGFLGGHLAERLVDLGWSVRVLDVREPVLDRSVDWVDADVRDGAAVLAAAARADVVFHLGAVVGVDRLLDDPVENIDVTVNGTRHALEAAAAAGAALVHLSTSEVLGLNPDLPWEEDASRVLGSALTDRWAYASAKAAAEHVVLAGAPGRGVAATVIRPFNVYGPRQEPRFVVPLMVRAALAGEPVEVHDDGAQTRCFTYVDDVVTAIVAAGVTPGLARLLHVGSTDEIAMADLASLVERLAGSTVPRRHSRPQERWGGRYQDIARRVPDPSRAEAVLGWQATTSLEDGLRQTIRWARRSAGAPVEPVAD